MSPRWSYVCSFIPVIAVACSSTVPQFDDAGVDGGSTEDAPGSDAESSSDASPDAPWNGNVVVHVRRFQFDGLPDATAVVFHADATGALRATETTGADGLVELTVTAGDSVTVRQGPQGSNLVTVAGVEPGDELWFGPPAFVQAGQKVVTVPPHPEGGEYEIRGPCMVPDSNPTPDVPVRWYPGCPDTRTVIAVAIGVGANGEDAYFTAPLTVANGGAVTLTGAWSEPVDVSLTLQNAPSDAVLSFGGALMSGEYTTPYDGFERGTQLQTITWQRPATLNDGTLFSIIFQDEGLFEVLKLLPPGTATIDLTRRVPTITDVSTTDGIAWTVSAADPIDAFVLYTAELDSKGQALSRWNFILPPEARALVRPQIPDPLDTSFYDIALVDVAGQGYDQFRPEAATNQAVRQRRVPAGYDVQTWKTRFH
jgi:hypothetical protein